MPNYERLHLKIQSLIIIIISVIKTLLNGLLKKLNEAGNYGLRSMLIFAINAIIEEFCQFRANATQNILITINWFD